MANHLESSTSPPEQLVHPQPVGWLKVGIITAASLLAGGLAGAWFYRKTLTRLHQAEESAQDSEYRISGDDAEEED
jgi:hypothetical protein